MRNPGWYKTHCKQAKKVYYQGLRNAVARVAQLDRASVYGTEDENPQPPCSSKTCIDSEPCACHSLCQTPVKDDPDLAALLDAWPTLPEPVKAGIVAMVKAAGQK